MEKYDKDVEAMGKCSNIFKELDPPERVRVIQHLVEKFSIRNTTSKESPVADPTVLHSHPVLDTINQLEVEAETVEAIPVEEDNYPSIINVVVKNLPKTEAEWVLIYGFYASKWGEEIFDRSQIIEQYETSNRKDKNTTKNLSSVINRTIKKDWIKHIKDKEYILLEEGKQYAKEILKGNSTGVSKKGNTKRKRK